MNVLKHKKIYYLISFIVIIPGILSLIFFGLKPSIDFTGGSRSEIQIESNGDISPGTIKTIIDKAGFKTGSINEISSNVFLIITNPLSEVENKKILTALSNQYPGSVQRSFETVGATIGYESGVKALQAVAVAIIAILLYIAFVFRKVSKPVASWKYGVCAVVALGHDVLIVLGTFSILGLFFGVEVNALFITAVLTVMGFSVHDTIVVFDRIRENLIKHPQIPFEKNVNNSILETFSRSLNTSITLVFVLVTLLLFGGETVRWFVVALLIGVISGTYSSIFNASLLLVSWYEFDQKKFNKKKE